MKIENFKNWGEKSGIKNSLKIRNSDIYKKYRSGTTINELTQEYYLSEKTIRRIISQEKRINAKTIQNYSID